MAVQLGNLLPRSGPLGTDVTVQVQGYPRNATGFTLSIGPTPIPHPALEQGDAEIQFFIPAGAQTNFITIAVTTPTGVQHATSAGQFTVTAGNPTMTLVQPRSVQAGGRIAVSGTNLQAIQEIGLTMHGQQTRWINYVSRAAHEVTAMVPGGTPRGQYGIDGRPGPVTSALTLTVT